MLQVSMAASLRQDFGKGASRRLRSAGNTPAILYGADHDPKALTMETKNLVKKLLAISGRNALIKLDVEGTEHNVIVKEIQTDPIKDSLVHTDFLEVSLDTPAMFSVQLNYIGVAKGVDMGGVLNMSKDGVMVKGLPLDIPDSIDVDVADLELNGKGITCGDLNISASVSLEEDEDIVCVSVIAPQRAELAEGEEELEEGAGEEVAAEAPAAE